MKPKRNSFRFLCVFGMPIRCGFSMALGFVVLMSWIEAEAGDILRGGATAAGGKPRPGANGGAPTPAATDAARANARDSLARTTRTLEAMRAMQQAARMAARKGSDQLGNPLATPPVTLPTVPNGLLTGGLKVSPLAATDMTKWTGAEMPKQTVEKGKTKITIKQTEQQALLNWETFNIGKKTTLHFDQSQGGADAGKWIAFNKVNDPTASPTQILGNIKAEGQVYVINTNGIIFGGSSQVNARGLTVSSLPINENLISLGLLNNPDAQYLFSGLDLPAGAAGTPAFIAERPLSPDGRYGDVIVQKGAVLNSPTNAAKVGGRIMLVGPNVLNEGAISTPDGQTILAAGLQVGLAAHAASDPSLRGLDVFIGAVEDATAGAYAGTATQAGIVDAPRGSITMAAKAIHQNGVLNSSTSVALNGRIDLLAHYDAIINPNLASSGSANALPYIYRKSGSIEVGSGAVMRILPEWDSKETTIGSELALRSRINLEAGNIHLGADSALLAPNALATLNAGEWILTGDGTTLVSAFVQSAGQVYFDRGALVDVSGSAEIAVPVSQNIISVDLRGAELADSPLLRNGVLRNKTIQVDIRDQGIYQNNLWVGTPLANIAGFANLIQKSVGQLTVAGGSVNISAGDSVVMGEGSKIDVSGGSILFTPGTVKTTQLITNGRLVDISAAAPDVVYDGIYDGTFTKENEKFGVFDIFNSPLAPDGSRYDSGSVQGGAGGALAIKAPAMALDGHFLGKTTTGEKQRLTPPARSSLALTFLSRDTTYQTLPDYAPTPPEIVFDGADSPPVTPPFLLDDTGTPPPLPTERLERVYLSPDLMSQRGFGIIEIDNRDGAIILPENVTLRTQGESKLTLNGSNITIDGSILSPGGELSFLSNNTPLDTLNLLANTAGGSLPAPLEDRGGFTLGSSARISTAGLLVDDRLTQDFSGLLPLFLDGGSINIRAYSANLATGGRLDVSGGAAINPRGAVTYGTGGSISVVAGRDPALSGVLGGKLALGATLSGFSGSNSGQLSMGAPAIQIGGTSDNPAITLIDPKLFSEGGFSSYSLTGTGLANTTTADSPTGLVIAPETLIRPKVATWLADTSGETFRLRHVTLAEGVRPTTTLAFNALGAIDPFSGVILGRGDVVLSAGASVVTDARGSVVFGGDTVTLLGSVTTPGGSISAVGAGRFPTEDLSLLLPTTLIGETARLSAAGKTLLLPNPFGLRQGQVLAGGSISLGGNIVAERGSILDVSGSRGVLDLAPAAALDPTQATSTSGSRTVPTEIHSNAGSVSMTGSRMLYSDATLIGRAGGSSATGGAVSISSGRFVPIGTPFNSAETNLVVRQDGFFLQENLVSQGLGAAALDLEGNVLTGIGNFSVSSMDGGGFDSLSLNGNVRFDGDVGIRMPGSIRVSTSGVIVGDGRVTLEAGYVNLGQAFTPPRLPSEEVILFTQTDPSGVTLPFQFAPEFGTGNLTVRGELIDIGNLSLQQFGSATFDASSGDIRGNGTLSAAGALSFKAGQIHPTTAGSFNIFAYDYGDSGSLTEGSVSIRAGSNRALPLSAGGSLGVFASQIIQGGTLRAPMGSIQLGWDGAGSAPNNPISGELLSSPVTALLTLASGGTTSVSALDPISGEGLVIPYGVSLDGNSWIDPIGNDITVGGVPAKSIDLSGAELVTEKGSLVEIDGGGDLYAYRWVSGNGGSKDTLASSGSFAILPGYQPLHAPYAPFNTSSAASNLDGLPGYVNTSLKVGDQITFAASKGLAAGTYTLLPARYALLEGAFLVTPKSGTPSANVVAPDGASIVAGYRSNNLDPSRSGATLITRFEIAPPKVIRLRSEYQDFLANTVLRDAAIAREFSVPRLPMDAGQLSFSSSAAMSLRGGVSALTPEKGRGGIIDINSAADILINSSGRAVAEGELVLSASLLNSFGVESLLIGGSREIGVDGTSVNVSTTNIRVDNEGSPLNIDDLILVAKQELRLEPGAEIMGTGKSDLADTLLIGDPNTAGSGDGVLVRVSGGAVSPIFRFGVSSSDIPNLVVDEKAILRGGGVVLDSTFGTSLDPTALLQATTVALSSGSVAIHLDNPGAQEPTTGLVLSGQALAGLQKSATSLSLSSYSNLDIYGSGTVGSRAFEQLTLRAPSIRGFNTGNRTATFSAKNLLIENPLSQTPAEPSSLSFNGTLVLDADEITLGANNTRVDGFSSLRLDAGNRILVSGEGSFATSGDADLLTPLLTGESAAKYRITSEGLMQFRGPRSANPTSLPGGLGAEISLEGGDLYVNSNVSLASGQLTLRATTGDLIIGDSAPTRLDVSGTETRFLDVMRYTGGGNVSLISDNGSILVDRRTDISVVAPQGGGNAGGIRVLAPLGFAEVRGSIAGTAGDKGLQGNFSLDTSETTTGSLAGLDRLLDEGGFTESRDYRIRNGDVFIDGPAMARLYRVAADFGSIVVSDRIDASGITGGTIDLKATGSVVLENGASLDVSASEFDAAGKGGSVVLEAGNQREGFADANAILDLGQGSVIDLSVAAADADSQGLGRFTGTLHLRAPRSETNDGLQINSIASSIKGASHILVEGVRLYDVSDSGMIDAPVQTRIFEDANTFLGIAGSESTTYTTIREQLLNGRVDIDPILVPGAEIFNSAAGISLGSEFSGADSDWNLSSFRFGPRNAAGVLTIRAAGNLTFLNALSDGFSGGVSSGFLGTSTSLWQSVLMDHNPDLPANAQSWSLRLAAGADLTAASHRAVLSPDSLAADSGLLQLGKDAGAGSVTGGTDAQTSSIIGNLFQVIRTGSGDIDISTARSVQLLNPFASIYTAGTQVSVPTTISAADDFVLPVLNVSVQQGNLGANQQSYVAQYSMAGGNVSIFAGDNIERKTRNNSGLIDDSSRQLPNNWLYRRGLVGPDGNFGKITIGSGFTATSDLAASTTWWVDFSNFFQGVGALGGGNIDIRAANAVNNIDAVIPTNARSAMGRPSMAAFLELGGGDLRVTSGSDISGGVYYVERGRGSLFAGGSITTNSTRSPSFGLTTSLNDPASATFDPLTWMPTTLFVGKSSFDLAAANDLLLGPVSNPFLLPQGVNNRFWYKSYFSTFSPESRVDALSFGGDLTVRNAITLPAQNLAQPMLRAWHESQLQLTGSASSTAWLQPWLRLAETNLEPFSPVWSLSASNLSLTSLVGDLNLVGDLTLRPAPTGQLELIAAGAINALQPTGVSDILSPGRQVVSWAPSTVNLSDANPSAIPAARRPLTSYGLAEDGAVQVSSETTPDFLSSLTALFQESGSITGSDAVLQTRQARHTEGNLHGSDAEPLRVYARDGNLSGLTLFSAKNSRISAGADISDVALYIQNLSSADFSVVSAGRDISITNASSPLRVAAIADGNLLAPNQAVPAGDIQISGPGNLQVIAGRNLDLGIGSSNPDGTGTGITSIGNFRNPYLPAKGADLTVVAGIGPASSIASSNLAFDSFIENFVLTTEGEKLLKDIAPGIDFAAQSSEEQARIATEVFYRILRDTGRDFNDPESEGYRKWDRGYDAIQALFPEETTWEGSILTQGRDIRTKSGGDINVLAPGGGLAMAETTLGNPLTPPGIITESGGAISLFTDQSVSIGIGRIFTLRGGDVLIWSSKGDIAAGSSSRTVQSAPPTRVVIDPQSASVETDLAGLATGGGIGVLATVKGVDPGDVDLIAPEGTIDAGDAGIRVSGNINLAAVTVVNAANISAGGSSTGAPATSVSAPSISAVTTASNAAAAPTTATSKPAEERPQTETESLLDQEVSEFSVQVISYGGGAAEEDDEENDEAGEAGNDSAVPAP